MDSDSEKEDILQEIANIGQKLHGYCSTENHCSECGGHLWDCEFCGAFQSMVCCDLRRERPKRMKKNRKK